MRHRNTMVIWVTSILIIIFMSVSVSPELRHKIRQFIGDKGKYKQIIQDIYEVERPPMVEIDEYCRKFLS